MRVLVILFWCLKHVYSEDDDKSGNTIEDSSKSIHSRRENTESFKIYEDVLARKPKFLTFNKEANKIRVEASFAVPLLSIPVSDESINGHDRGNTALTVPKVDVNLKSVVTVASIFLLVFIILPQLFQIHSLVGENHHYFRSSGNTVLENAAKLMSETLDHYNMDLESCTQKAVCWTINKVMTKLEQGRTNGPEKFIDAISSTAPYLKDLFGNTSLWSLMKRIFFRHNENENCEQFNEKCVITSEGISLVAGSLLTSMRSRKL